MLRKTFAQEAVSKGRGTLPTLWVVENYLLEEDWCLDYILMDIKEEFSQEKLDSSGVCDGVESVVIGQD